MIRPALVVFILLANFLGPPSLAGERITRFHSEVEIHRDRSLSVTESIDVIADHATIKHGIYRDFPTVYPHATLGNLGFSAKTGFELVSVSMDGQAVPWHQENLKNGIRLYIGDPEKYVSRGPHRYQISYITTHQVSSYSGLDQLIWNVNGQGWSIPADLVSAHVTTADQGPILDYTAWTGPTGSREADFSAVENSDGSVAFSATRPLRPKEGMTISVLLAPGALAAESGGVARFLRDNAFWLGGLSLLMLLPLYYILAWRKVGRDPQKGVVMADYHPVRNLSPAAHRYVTANEADDTAFSAALVNIAIKGYMQIEQSGDKSFILHRRSPDPRRANDNTLTDAERALYAELFANADQVILEKEYDKQIADAKKHLSKQLKHEWGNAIYRDNRVYSWLGLLVGMAALFLCSLHINQGTFSFESLIPYGLFLFVGITLTRVKFHPRVLLPALFLIASGVMQGALSLGQSSPMIGLSLFVAATFLLFNYLLMAATPFGQKLLDEIEGFRLYLATAEQNRLNILHPPEKTPELFEKLLPYAIALEVENQWGEQFSDILDRATMEQGGYRPAWYSGNRVSGFHRAGFGSAALGASLASTVASAATAPGSSSGGFSGGAGGGGGGGGGGGW